MSFRNEFLYSHSRWKSFSECERRYYLGSYAFWGGWARNADPLSSLCYRLSKQTNLDMWAGTIVHETINRVLPLSPIPGWEMVESYALEAMRAGWKHALQKRYETRPKGNLNLHELYYGLEIPPEKTEAIKQKVLRCLDHFMGSEALDRILDIPREDWLELEEFQAFDQRGLKIALAVDFAHRQDEEIHIYDWKTGRPREADVEQVHTYALYAINKWGAKAEGIRVHLCYLQDDYEETFSMTELELLGIQAKIEERAKTLAGKLQGGDIAKNKPLPMQEFRMTEDRSTCRRCSFWEACYGSRVLSEIDAGAA